MKKQLLALAVAAMTTLAGMANSTVAFVASGYSYSGDGTTQSLSGTVAGSSYTQDDIKITFVKVNTSSSQSTGSLFRWYANDKITVTPLNGAVVKSVSFVGVGSSYRSVKITCGTTELPTGSETRTWTGSSADELTFTAGAQVRFGAFEVVYEMATPAAVERPEFTVTEGTESFIVSLSCATEGAEIYYTEDGTEPTTASTKYEKPFELYTGTTTVKAIAAKDGEVSSVSTKEIEVPYMFTDLMNIAGVDESMLEEMGGSVKFIATCDMSYVYQHDAYLYVTDGMSYMLLYGTSETYQPGDKFTRLEGTFKYYNGLPEVQNYTLTKAAESGAVVAPMAVEAEEASSFLMASMANRYLKFTGATISEVSASNGKMTVGEAEVELYNRFSVTGFENGQNMTVTGIVGLFKGTVQFQPTEILNEAGEKMVEAPAFNLADGAYTAGTEIVISCATEGATIHYCINDGEMESAEAPVTLVLTEEMTIEAFAAMEGMADSETVTATYTVKEEEPIEGTTAVFDFTSADAFSSIETEASYPASGENTPVSGTEMTVNGVSFVPSKAEGGTNPAIYYNGFALRMYSKNTLTFTIQSGYTIEKITFTNPSGQSLPGMNGVTNGVWTRPEVSTQAEDNGAVEFTVTAIGRLASIAVDFKKIDVGVESVAVEDGAETVYYNLQGVRVENPANGLYIRVAGQKASKVFVR